MTESTKPAETARELLRHAVAVVAYRGAKALRGAPDDFGALQAGQSTRKPVEIKAISQRPHAKEHAALVRVEVTAHRRMLQDRQNASNA